MYNTENIKRQYGET